MVEPFYVGPGEPASSKGRLLLVGSEFPPAGTAGALRWQKLAGYAARRGWGLDVVTVDPSTVKNPDHRRLDDLPPGTRVYGAPMELLLIDRVERWMWPAIERVRGWVRSAATGPVAGEGPSDAPPKPPRTQSYSRAEVQELPLTPRALVRTYYAYLLVQRQRKWASLAARIARTVVRPGVHRAVVSCGPTHMAHPAASALARKLGLPHVMDMRDPWSLVERLPEVVSSPWLFRNARRLESDVVEDVALVVCNTQAAAESMRELYPRLRGDCISVMNGFDEEPVPEPRDDGCFRLAYAGSIYLDRDPTALFRGAAGVIRELELTPADLCLEFMGDVKSYNRLTLDDLARQEGLDGYVLLRPRGTRSEALEFLASAAMLVSLPQDSAMAIPSKIFEYMAYDAWLLAMTEEDTATGHLLRGSGADVVAPDDVDAIADVICRRYREYEREGRPAQPALVAEASREHQSEKLFDALEERLHG